MATDDKVMCEAEGEARLGVWTVPSVKRLAAGAAENAAGTNADDQINHS